MDYKIYDINYSIDEKANEDVEEQEDHYYGKGFKYYAQKQNNNMLEIEEKTEEDIYTDGQIKENDNEEEIYQIERRQKTCDNNEEMKEEKMIDKVKNNFYHKDEILDNCRRIEEYDNGGIIKEENQKNKINLKSQMKNEGKIEKLKKQSKIMKVYNNIPKIKTDINKNIQQKNINGNNNFKKTPQLSITSISVSNTENKENQSFANNNLEITSYSSRQKITKEIPKISANNTENCSCIQNQSSSYVIQNKNQNKCVNKPYNKIPQSSKGNKPPIKSCSQNYFHNILDIKNPQNNHIKHIDRNEDIIENNISYNYNNNQKMKIQKPQFHVLSFILNNLKYYIRCPNCNYLLNDIHLGDNDLNINICNDKNDINERNDVKENYERNERDQRQKNYRKEIEERKLKEKKESEERELRERKKREERLKSQIEEREKKRKNKKARKTRKRKKRKKRN